MIWWTLMLNWPVLEFQVCQNFVANQSKFATYKVPLNENKRCIATHDMSRIQHQGSLKTLFRDIYYCFLYSHERHRGSLFFIWKISTNVRILFQNRNIYGIYILTNPNFTNFFISGCRNGLNLFYFHWKNSKYVDFESWWNIFFGFLKVPLRDCIG